MSDEIRPATPDDRPAVLGIMRAALGWPDGERAEELWRWKHEANPFGASPVWVGVTGGEVVAVRTFMRWELIVPSGEVVRAVRAVDTATRADHQGRGWFRRLTMHGLDELDAEGVDLVFNTPNDASRPGYLSMGWTDQGRVPAWVRLLRPSAAIRLARARVPAALWPLPMAGGLAPATAFADAVALAEAVGRSPHPADGVLTRRSPAFYRWRYGLESLGYRVVTGDGGLRDGFAVVRVRRRGPAREVALLEVVAPADRRRALVKQACRAGRGDHAVALGRRPAGAWVRVPGLGPRLVARPIRAPHLPERWELGLGDVELL